MSSWELVEHRREGNNVCVVFIHGFAGDAAKTWENFPSFATEDRRLADWDILSFGYESDLAPDGAGMWSGDPEIHTIADQLRTFWTIELTDSYRGAALVAHSMGGLVAQRALVDDEDFTAHVSHLFLFGTPSDGLWKARPFRLPLLRRLKRTMRDMAKGSEFITDLRERWSVSFGDALPFGFLAVAGAEDEFVPRYSSLDAFPIEYRAVIPGNHLSIVKPESADDPAVQLVIRGIDEPGVPQGSWNAIPEVNSARIAIERLDFRSVIDRLGLHRDDIDEAGLVDLALALDSLGKREEAIATLERRGKTGTDAMGVLAGRLKRAWIWDRRTEDAERASELYLEAYKRADREGDHPQAYYHGINVAFMYLAYHEDLKNAREWASKVLQHCQAAAQSELPSARVWGFATEGEANLILGKREAALERYQAAVASKPKPWQLASMYGQALYDADALEDEEAAKGLLEVFGEAPP